MGNKKGTVLVEAAIVYPIAIAVVMVLFYLVISMFISGANTAHTNMELRQGVMNKYEKGEVIKNGCDNTLNNKYLNPIFAEEPKNHETCLGMNKILQIRYDKEYHGNKMISKNVVKEHYGRIYLIDEVKTIRMIDSVAK